MPMSPTCEQLEKRIIEIEKRNAKVELEKKWEQSTTRKTLIAGITYFLVVITFFVIGVSQPFVNAIIPTLGFLCSTLTLPLGKKLWGKYFK